MCYYSVSAKCGLEPYIPGFYKELIVLWLVDLGLEMITPGGVALKYILMCFVQKPCLDSAVLYVIFPFLKETLFFKKHFKGNALFGSFFKQEYMTNALAEDEMKAKRNLPGVV